MKNIYLVITASGEYEDYREHVECAFSTREEADKYARELDNKKSNITQEDLYLYGEAMDWLYVYEDRNPALFENKISFNTSPIKCMERNNEIQAIRDKLTINYLKEHGMDMSNKTISDLDESYMNQHEVRHPSVVQEVPFIK